MTETQRESRLSPRAAKLLLLGLGVYVLVIAVLAGDTVFGWGLVRPRLDRDLIARIETFDAAPSGLPSGQLAALKQAASPYIAPTLDGRVVEVAIAVYDAASGFEVGSLPAEETVKGIPEAIEALRKAEPPAADPQVMDALAKMAGDLRDLRQGTVPKDPGAAASLEKRREDMEYVINYHEFSVPHLIRALKDGTPAEKAAAGYCLQQIAWRFFRHRGGEGTDAAQWEAWWRQTEAELDRRSAR